MLSETKIKGEQISSAEQQQQKSHEFHPHTLRQNILSDVLFSPVVKQHPQYIK